MPTDPTARDVATARRIAGRCWYATSDDPHATCDTVGASDRCVQCAEADAIAAALAAARAAEREAIAVELEPLATQIMLDGSTRPTCHCVARLRRATAWGGD